MLAFVFRSNQKKEEKRGQAETWFFLVSYHGWRNGNPQYTLHDQGIFDSGCSRHMIGNKSLLIDYQVVDGGFVAFAGSPKGGKITRKGKIRTGKLDFEDVYFVKELKFNLFSVLQMCDKKNSVLFTETECLVLSPNFKLLDESQVFLKVPKQNNMCSFDLKNVVPLGEGKATQSFFSYTLVNIQNRVLVTKPHNKTPYELLHGRPPSISFMRPFGCPVTILNTLDSPRKNWNDKAMRGSGPDWLFDIDLLTNSMNYKPVTAGNQTNKNVVVDDVGKKTNEEPTHEGERNGQEKEGGASNKENGQNVHDFRAELDNLIVQQKEGYANNTNKDSTVSPSVSTARQNFTNVDDLPTDPLIPDY
ncbi:hypothetical protein Tco_0008299 [Tanacetum coccineum]